MNEKFLSGTALFRGITPQEIEVMLKCLHAQAKKFEKGSRIYSAGNSVTDLGLVLSGNVLIENNDIWGNTTVLDRVGSGQIFAETYACTPGEPLMVNVTAAETTEILFLNITHILQVCSRTCHFHTKLLRNLLEISAQKNLNLSRKIFHTSSKTIRGRLLSYLSYQAVINGSSCFYIPFNRQQLADYLNVERSALSNELSKMQKEGLLKLDRNYFELLQNH